MLTAATNRQSADLFVDAHVHIYPFMSLGRLLDAAGRNLLGQSEQTAAGADGVLLVADPDGVHGYERLLTHAAADEGDGAWRREGGDGRSVTFRHVRGTRITAVRGQQLITREGLEVLGVGYPNALPMGLTLVQMVERIRAAGGWSILAWGVGKWLGRRGRLLTELIVAEAGQPDVMLADNGGRPRFWARVPQFETAAERGMRIVAGTDPLPLPGEERRVGSYGFRIRVENGGANDETPADRLRRGVEMSDARVEIVGRQMPIGAFISNQLRLRLRRVSRSEKRP